jgi:hypothetical protein
MILTDGAAGDKPLNHGLRGVRHGRDVRGSFLKINADRPDVPLLRTETVNTPKGSTLDYGLNEAPKWSAVIGSIADWPERFQPDWKHAVGPSPSWFGVLFRLDTCPGHLFQHVPR